MLSLGRTVLLTVLVCWLTLARSLRHHLTIHNDDRKVFKIETFGFVVGGEMEIKVTDFTLHFKGIELEDFKNSSKLMPSPAALPPAPPAVPAATVTAPVAPAKPVAPAAPVAPASPVASATPGNATSRRLQSQAQASVPLVSPHLIGFVMRHAKSESAAQSDLEGIMEKHQCILDKLQPHDVFLDLSDPDSWKSTLLQHEVTADSIGLYSLIFQRCYPAGLHHTSFKLDATFYNPGPNYLSAGDAPLPTMYLVFFLLFAAALGAWGWQLYGRPSGIVHRIHHMMYWLLVLKSLSLFFESVRYHYIALYGVSKMWSEVYYVFAFLKGIMLFTVILLIGSGWSLMKSYLSDQEKRIVWVVLSLQVLDNIAMIVLEETAPGSQGWLTWRDILHLVDIICCCAILLPIVWSIRHLRMAAEVDGKAHNSLLKLQLFRQFYVMVVVYIYFTRIVVFLLAATVPFYLLWLGPFSTEVATLLFFVVTGYKFRPAEDNPYLPVRSEGLEGEEYGLEEDGLGGDFEMTPATTRSSK